MPITPFRNGERFDPETTRVLGVALEMVCIALRTGDCDDDDEDTYNLIMRDKERLLDPTVALRFIFSHSALAKPARNALRSA
jgi:hypothetical protein